jgi:hypothetical protein
MVKVASMPAFGERIGMASASDLSPRCFITRAARFEILATPEPKPYQRLNPPPSILDPFADDLADDEQRHTARKIGGGCATSSVTSAAMSACASTCANATVVSARRSFHSPRSRATPRSGLGHIYVDLLPLDPDQSGQPASAESQRMSKAVNRACSAATKSSTSSVLEGTRRWLGRRHDRVLNFASAGAHRAGCDYLRWRRGRPCTRVDCCPRGDCRIT